MRVHTSTLHERMRRAGARVTLRFRVVAVGVDRRGRFIAISTNSPLFAHRSRHAEETLMHKAPRSLAKVLIARVGKRGNWLPIDPCERCMAMASKRGIVIEALNVGEWQDVRDPRYAT